MRSSHLLLLILILWFGCDEVVLDDLNFYTVKTLTQVDSADVFNEIIISGMVSDAFNEKNIIKGFIFTTKANIELTLNKDDNQVKEIVVDGEERKFSLILNLSKEEIEQSGKLFYRAFIKVIEGDITREYLGNPIEFEFKGGWIREEFTGYLRERKGAFVLTQDNNQAIIGSGCDLFDCRTGFKRYPFWKFSPSTVGKEWVEIENGPKKVGSNYNILNAVAFQIGDIIYYGTGFINNNVTNHFFSYNLKTSETNELELPQSFKERKGAVGFAVRDSGYIGFGMDDNEKDLHDFWRFDPSAESLDKKWKEIKLDAPEGMVLGRSYGLAVVVDNEKNQSPFVLIGGGLEDSWESDKFFKFYPQDYKIKSLNPFPDYIIGGIGFAIENNIYIGMGELSNILYRLDGDNWKKETSLSSLHALGSAVGFSLNEKGYIVTGVKYLNINGKIIDEFSPNLWIYIPK